MTVARILLTEEEAREMLDRLPGSPEFYEAAADAFIRLQRGEDLDPLPQQHVPTKGQEGRDG